MCGSNIQMILRKVGASPMSVDFFELGRCTIRLLCRRTVRSHGPQEGLPMNRTIFSLVRVITCGLFLMFAVGVANAQFKAAIQGTVTDTSGGLVPQAKVTLTNSETS